MLKSFFSIYWTDWDVFQQLSEKAKANSSAFISMASTEFTYNSKHFSFTD